MSDKDECECCGAFALANNCYPYGTCCKACGDDVCHPTGYGFCFVEDGKAHSHRRPADWKPHEEGL